MKIYLHTVGIIVKDMPKALAFYRLLGLDIPVEEDHSPHVEYTDSRGYAIGFISEDLVRKSDPKWVDSFGQRVNLQFRLETPSEVDELHKKLIDAGYANYQDPWDAVWGERFARIVDTEGNVVNLFSAIK